MNDTQVGYHLLQREGIQVLEPLPETKEALAELISFDEPELDDVLLDLGQRARAIVPELVGLSLTLLHEGLTLTLVASGSAAAGVDATQYLDGGPCVQAVEEPEEVDGPGPTEVVIEDLFDEERWQLYAQASSAVGIASSLSMPLEKDGEMTGGINLYASTSHAFTGHHQDLAGALGTSALRAVANADLTFSSRLLAVEAPAQVRATREVDTAVGVLAVRYGEDVEAARKRLRDAAARAGVSETLVARVIMVLRNDG